MLKMFILYIEISFMVQNLDNMKFYLINLSMCVNCTFKCIIFTHMYKIKSCQLKKCNTFCNNTLFYDIHAYKKRTYRFRIFNRENIIRML